jgi:hypothetical protein
MLKMRLFSNTFLSVKFLKNLLGYTVIKKNSSFYNSNNHLADVGPFLSTPHLDLSVQIRFLESQRNRGCSFDKPC